MSNVIELLKTKKEEDLEHITGEAECIACKHRWVAVAPTGIDILECPACSLMKGYFKYPIDRKEELIWECSCGNTLFRIVPDGTYCPNCGNWQTGF